MKKALAILLAMCLLCVVGAIGAGALLTEQEWDEIRDLRNAVSEPLGRTATIAHKGTVGNHARWYFINASSEKIDGNLAAFKEGKTPEDYWAALLVACDADSNATYAKFQALFAKYEYDESTVSNYNTSIEALYRNGKLKAFYEEYFTIYYVYSGALGNATHNNLANEFFKPEALEPLEPYAKLDVLLDSIQQTINNSEIADKFMDAIDAKYDECIALDQAFEAALQAGNWAEAMALTVQMQKNAEEIKNLVDAAVAASAPDPIFDFFASFLPEGVANVLTFIVKYIFFGWLWGRWL